MLKQHLWPLITSILLLGIGGISIYLIYQNWADTEMTMEDPAISEVKPADESSDLTSIIHSTEKNVMLIEGQNEEETITGSGFLYNNKGDIVTNAHVVKNADLIYVRTANARYYPAALVNSSEKTDIAIVRVPQLAGQMHLQTADKEADVGDEVVALGSPHGFQNTVTVGIISGTRRHFSVDGFDYQNAYQISAQLTQGNSGGPLIDRSTGKVLGINAVGTKDGTIGFSIPIKNVLPKLKKWSREAENDELDFAGTENILETDGEQLVTDAEYLVEYFFDSLAIRDYVEAYTILGSEIQDQTSYPEFRKNYTQTVDISYEGIQTALNDNKQVEATANVDIKTKQPDKDKKTTQSYRYQFLAGHENEQLKLLEVAREEVD